MKADNYLTPSIEKQLREELGDLSNIAELVASDYTVVNFNDIQTFTALLFDIKYKPLNTFRLNNIKEEEQNYRLEQLDTPENAISNFDEMVVVEQQKVNRLGNEVITKNRIFI